MSNEDDFQARLNRLNARKESTAAPQNTANKGGARQAAPRSGAKFPLLVIGVLAVGAAVIGGALIYAPTLQAQQAEASAVRESKGATALYLESAGAKDPFVEGGLQFMPEAPEGWSRFTGIDVRDPGIKAGLHGIASPNTKFKEGTGFAALADFYSVFNDPNRSMQLRTGDRPLASAIFLMPDGERFMDVRVDMRSRPMGPSDAPDEWDQALDRTYGRDQSNNSKNVRVENSRITWAKLGGRKALIWYDFRSVPRNFDKMMGPEFRNVDGRLQVKVAIAPNVILDVSGFMRLADVEALLAGLPPAIAASAFGS